jgi:hypothetical protein
MEFLILIFNEAQVLYKPKYGKYNENSPLNKKWNFLQIYIESFIYFSITCLIFSTYMHMVNGI